MERKSENAKAGQKRRKIFFCAGNGREEREWDLGKGHRRGTVPGRWCPFCCESIVNPSQLQVIKICSTCLESLKASEAAVQVGLPIATSDK